MIIWGSKAKEREIATGSFYCPGCRNDSLYSRRRISRYFTLYFIPLFPTGTLGDYVRCTTCNTEFPDTILQCTREEIEKAIEPWSCTKCNNKNHSSTKNCLSCGANRYSVPPQLPGALPPLLQQ